MSAPAIRVQNLSKRYQIGAREEANKTFREALMDIAGAPLRRFKQLSGKGSDEESFLALSDVSFEVQPGEVVGIIGRNGAGKSTLLKVLSQITEPTTGRIELNGRVASLLEVGTGFHPELTGRENIFLNGAILGMSREEIKRKFEEIVDFAEIEKFLDTPVKRYSSGMYVRLAFAVAAHLEPEILIVDEVLAVGDAGFQKKCLGKMRDVGTQGRTVLFVSHNMPAVEALCGSAVLLDSGRLLEQGVVGDVLRAYSETNNPTFALRNPLKRATDGPQLVDFELLNNNETKTHSLSFLSPAKVRFTLEVPEQLRGMHFVLRLLGTDGTKKASVTSRESACPILGHAGECEITVDIPSLTCLPGAYTWALELYRPLEGRHFRSWGDLWEFEILPGILPGATHPYGRDHGAFFIEHEIRVNDHSQCNT